jgi:hypothetical protein
MDRLGGDDGQQGEVGETVVAWSVGGLSVAYWMPRAESAVAVAGISRTRRKIAPSVRPASAVA